MKYQDVFFGLTRATKTYLPKYPNITLIVKILKIKKDFLDFN